MLQLPTSGIVAHADAPSHSHEPEPGPTAEGPQAPCSGSSTQPSSRASALAALRRMPSGEALLISLVLPLNAPSAFGRLGVAPPRGVLLHGPAGCGKTSLARLVASAAAANFVEVHAAHLISSALGASEAAVARLFAAARAAAPCVLFLDGLEALAPPRGADTSTEGTMDRLLSLLLTEMDGALRFDGPPVVVLGATRHKADLDPSILRPGRLDVHVAIGTPSAAERERLLHDMLRRTPVRWEPAKAASPAQADARHPAEGSGGAVSGDVSLAWLVQLCEGCSVADLSAFCREAAMAALREQLSVDAQSHGCEATVGAAHFLKAVEFRRTRDAPRPGTD